MKKYTQIFAVIFSLLVLASCSTNNKSDENSQTDAKDTQDVSAIVLSTNSAEISVDETYQITYTALPKDVKDVTILWSSADESVATIDEAGIVSGISEGQTSIVAECENGVYAICSVTVTGKSAYDSLSNKEKEFVDLFVENINIFYDPESVTIKYYSQATLNSTGTWDITVSAHNQMGGFSEKDYTMDRSGTITEPILGHVIMPGWESECDLDLINAAIKERIS